MEGGQVQPFEFTDFLGDHPSDILDPAQSDPSSSHSFPSLPPSYRDDPKPIFLRVRDCYATFPAAKKTSVVNVSVLEREGETDTRHPSTRFALVKAPGSPLDLELVVRFGSLVPQSMLEEIEHSVEYNLLQLEPSAVSIDASPSSSSSRPLRNSGPSSKRQRKNEKIPMEATLIGRSLVDTHTVELKYSFKFNVKLEACCIRFNWKPDAAISACSTPIGTFSNTGRIALTAQSMVWYCTSAQQTAMSPSAILLGLYEWFYIWKHALLQRNDQDDRFYSEDIAGMPTSDQASAKRMFDRLWERLKPIASTLSKDAQLYDLWTHQKMQLIVAFLSKEDVVGLIDDANKFVLFFGDHKPGRLVMAYRNPQLQPSSSSSSSSPPPSVAFRAIYAIRDPKKKKNKSPIGYYFRPVGPSVPKIVHSSLTQLISARAGTKQIVSPAPANSAEHQQSGSCGFEAQDVPWQELEQAVKLEADEEELDADYCTS